MEAEHKTKSEIALSLSQQTRANSMPIKKLETEKLFGEANEILIMHAGEHYMLTITKQKKLILTKAKQCF